ncbi:hypothetical protein CapIbe_010993 [Capra ibex]
MRKAANIIIVLASAKHQHDYKVLRSVTPRRTGNNLNLKRKSGIGKIRHYKIIPSLLNKAIQRSGELIQVHTPPFPTQL